MRCCLAPVASHGLGPAVVLAAPICDAVIGTPDAPRCLAWLGSAAVPSDLLAVSLIALRDFAR
eukprot:257882-Chlamydomonas_euryale.AAC.2